ncbi:aldo/keto reductase [Streptomyces antimycoticus]|uniref:aldo/keto reductase n=1 Tax=Streptomyces antimycoticus TaxID=68175 RepID=UPI001374AB9F|nr:aldo/keto reductase [Streptomyces antimycoticus]
MAVHSHSHTTRPGGPDATAVTRIVLGGRFGEEDKSLSFTRLDRFAERGGRYVDTAHSYADGRSEKVIGAWLRATGANLEVLTKVGHPDDSGVLDLSPSRLRAEADESRRRLGRETVDFLLLHRDDATRPVVELSDTLMGFARRGEARRIGVSNWSAPRLAQLVPLLLADGLTPVVSYQHSLAEPGRPLWPETRDAREVASVLMEFGLDLFAWAAQARGFFAGRTEPVGDQAADPFDTPVNQERRTRCRELAERLGQRPETVALAWTLCGTDAYPIVGARTLAELETSLAAAALDLGEDTCHWLEHGVPSELHA